MKEPQELTWNLWRKTKMTKIDPKASLNWVRLLMISTNPNQIQTDRFRPTIPTRNGITYCTRKRWENHKNWQETHGARANDRNPSKASFAQLRNDRTNFRKDTTKENEEKSRFRPTCKISVIYGPGYEHWWQNLFYKTFALGSDHPKTLHRPAILFWAIWRNEYKSCS